MQRPHHGARSSALAAVIALLPATAAALPTCAQLGTEPIYGLAGNPQIVSGTLTAAIIPLAPAVGGEFVV